VVTGEGQVVGRLNLLMLLLALAALTASTLGLLSTTTATVVERGVELGLMRALGASAPQIAVLLLGETVLVSLLGGALGWGLGSAGAAAIRGHTFGTVVPVQPLLLPLALVLSLALAVVGTLAPLRLALRIDPATVLRG
jgi:putative ABC transport system permease protein